ncbi:dihydrolipoamide dehydrogenase [Nakamurella panacisegetis]|uniref:Dihydrolipoamide dehydrogenase n=1 Tax=Nakamurella panacisegetis TaxID=1090615 RepID=A0A1H0KJK0_9ACTN|nr:NAD(P)/FAD-dependent oxidoreductase [Nakamurella panacisegetis]SDO56119.1 dihydrolipoamide dehydrogenase [Nakamurella panacisegetis]
MPDNSNSTPTDTWDVVVIGGAPPGENVAQYATQGSDRTAVIIEKELVGGECSFWACMPSKALLRPISVLDNARNLPGVQSLVGDHSLDNAAVLRRRDEIVHHHDDTSQVDWATGVGIDVVRGHARLAGERTVEVTAADGSVRTIHARLAVVLDTGTTATVPPIPGLREARPWISRDATNMHEIPRRIAIIGGGVVACEAATWLAGMGVQVTIIGSAPKLLARNEEFAGDLVADNFRAKGMTVHLNARVDAVSRPQVNDAGEGLIHGGEVTVTFGDSSVTVDEVLVAAGRTPASRDIGLETIGSVAEAAAAHRGFVTVDKHFGVEGVDGDWLYAIGDLNGKALLTHMGKYQARICGAVIAARAEGRDVQTPWTTDSGDDVVPQVTFTDPEVASVGLTEAAARAAGLTVRGVEYDLSWLAGTSLQRDNYVGRAKIVVDEDTHALLGATFVGPDVSDLLHAATVAIVGKVTLEQLWHAVPSYPTVSEIWLRLLETYFNPPSS